MTLSCVKICGNLIPSKLGRIWTADRLAKRGWPNCGLCPLCKQSQESAAHLFFRCRFTIRVWKAVMQRFGIEGIDTDHWHLEESLTRWWARVTKRGNTFRSSMASLTMLVSWTIWNERNARIFRNKSAPPPVLLNNIIEEAKLWVTAGARKLGNIVFCE